MGLKKFDEIEKLSDTENKSTFPFFQHQKIYRYSIGQNVSMPVRLRVTIKSDIIAGKNPLKPARGHAVSVSREKK